MKFLTEMVNKLFTTVADLSSQMATIVTELRDLRGCLSSNNSVSSSPYDPAQLQKLVREETREIHEREKRKNSVIIRGKLLIQFNFDLMK